MLDSRVLGPDAYKDKLEEEKKRSTMQLLFKAARLLNERAIERIRKETNQPVRVAHTTLLPHVDLDEGTRLTDLAHRLGVTKQAAGQLVDELVEMGLLERAPDPIDARAKLVRFSKRGRAALLEGLGVLRDIEEELRKVIGDAKMRALHEGLATVVATETARGNARERSMTTTAAAFPKEAPTMKPKTKTLTATTRRRRDR